MATADDGHPPGLDETLLRDLVSQMLPISHAKLGAWRGERLPYGGTNPVSGGLYRLSGTAHNGGETVPWSLILKVVRSPSGLDAAARDGHVVIADDMAHWNYWKREVLAYQSGILEDLGGGLVVPRVYAVMERPGGMIWLWLEDIVEASATPWPVERYGVAARHLGTWQGTYLAGRPLPEAPWLARGWLRSWRADFAALDHVTADAATWEHPRAQQAFGRPLVAAYQRLAAEEAAWTEVLDSMPQTLCHYDFLRANLLARRVAGKDETVAIDWSYVGPGPVGEDAGILVFGSLLRPEVEVKDFIPLGQTVYAGYLAGLQMAGWQGDPGLVRMSFCLATAIHGALTVPLLVLWAVTDETSHAWMEQQFAHPISELVPQWGALSCYLLDLADEARTRLTDYQGRQG